MTEELLTVRQASVMFGEKTVQSIYEAIKKGRLKVSHESRPCQIRKKDLIEYHETKHSVLISKYDGKPVYNLEQGEISVSHAAKLCGIRPTFLYFKIRRGKIGYIKRGKHLVLRHEEVMQFYKDLLARRDNPQQMRFV
jgi:excisionase family DNA binding protein